jgi:hypothetical protein
MCRGQLESNDLFALSKTLCRLTWPKAAPIHHFLARLFGEQRHAARRARPFESIIHSSRGTSSTSDLHFLAGDGKQWRETRTTQRASSTVIVLSRLQLVSPYLLFIYAARSGLTQIATY